MKNFTCHKTTLSNGLRIITVPMANSPSATAMVLVEVGSRHEPDDLAGISHFIEHNVFKGTKNRPHRNQIAEEIEGMGGVSNPGTYHDFTDYWIKASASQCSRILDIAMDISQNMTFPKEDLEVERGNVIEEIRMRRDDPVERLYRDFINFIWGEQPVGRYIYGSEESVRKISREQMLEFVKQNYVPERKVVVVAGKFNEEQVRSQITDYHDNIENPPFNKPDRTRFNEFQFEPRIYLDTDDTKQTHLCLGVKIFGRHDKRRYALDLLDNILGHGLSSRLHKKIRDDLGLAYYVGSANLEFEETGLWAAMAGVNTQRVEKAILAILEEFKKLTQEKVGEAEIRKAKEYVKGKTLLGVETSDDLAQWYGFQELLEDEVLSPEEYNQRIEAVTADDLQAVAQGLIKKEKWNLGLVGPFEEKEKFEDLLAKF